MYQWHHNTHANGSTTNYVCRLRKYLMAPGPLGRVAGTQKVTFTEELKSALRKLWQESGSWKFLKVNWLPHNQNTKLIHVFRYKQSTTMSFLKGSKYSPQIEVYHSKQQCCPVCQVIVTNSKTVGNTPNVRAYVCRGRNNGWNLNGQIVQTCR